MKWKQPIYEIKSDSLRHPAGEILLQGTNTIWYAVSTAAVLTTSNKIKKNSSLKEIRLILSVVFNILASVLLCFRPTFIVAALCKWSPLNLNTNLLQEQLCKLTCSCSFIQAVFQSDIGTLLEHVGTGKESLSFMRRRIRRLSAQWASAARRLDEKLRSLWREQKRVNRSFHTHTVILQTVSDHSVRFFSRRVR